jgi:17beta-estradiol 17-dehydrogenase / very-long-chain 3-oxoacyl-CoA reductase
VILHGRNPDKLEGVKSRLLARFPDRECEILLLDASTCFSQEQYATSRDAILEVSKDRCVTLLINNVGIGHGEKDFTTFTTQKLTSIEILLNTNIGFMTHLTQILLPILAKNAPSLVINVGSLAQLAMPYIAVYSGTKAYMNTFTKALDNEMRAEKIDVTVECMVLGDVDTPVHPMKPSLSVLGAEDAAKYILDRAGSMGYWGLQPVGAPY